MYNEDHLHAIGEKFRPKPDNLKLLLVAGAALLSTIILISLLASFYWDGQWHLKTPAGENISHADSHSTDPAETHEQPASAQPAAPH